MKIIFYILLFNLLSFSVSGINIFSKTNSFFTKEELIDKGFICLESKSDCKIHYLTPCYIETYNPSKDNLIMIPIVDYKLYKLKSYKPIVIDYMKKQKFYSIHSVIVESNTNKVNNFLNKYIKIFWYDEIPRFIITGKTK